MALEERLVFIFLPTVAFSSSPNEVKSNGHKPINTRCQEEIPYLSKYRNTLLKFVQLVAQCLCSGCSEPVIAFEEEKCLSPLFNNSLRVTKSYLDTVVI
jgi:hypothetical protein